MAPIIVNLTPAEVFAAAMSGVMRQVENMDRRKNAYGLLPGSDWQVNIEGACGEQAVAKALNLYLPPKGTFRGSDVACYQVRTRSNHNYDLIVHPKDDDEAAYVLVTGLAPHYVVRGWIRGRDAKQSKYWRDPAGGRPAYFVPQTVLRDMSELHECTREVSHVGNLHQSK